ncbi:MAG: hypothetical protein JXP34_08790 [Planctomycetes bacterium]|nr:hypothetical protein [Planctomycetota bacterium]
MMRTPREVLTSSIRTEPPAPERGPGIARVLPVLAWGIAAAGIAYLILVHIRSIPYEGLSTLPSLLRGVLYASSHPGLTLLPLFTVAAIPLFRIRTPARAVRLAAIYLAAGVFVAVILVIIAYMPLIGTPLKLG